MRIIQLYICALPLLFFSLLEELVLETSRLAQVYQLQCHHTLPPPHKSKHRIENRLQISVLG